MRLMLDYSVTMGWFLGEGKPEEMAYAGKVLGDIETGQCSGSSEFIQREIQPSPFVNH